MAAGCLPIVHSCSGLLEVIVRNGKYGLTYTQKKIELSELLIYAFDPAKDFNHKLRNRALDFDIKHFKKKIDMLIDMT
jgi:hypothetical protein